jgi:hypothetical protein
VAATSHALCAGAVAGAPRCPRQHLRGCAARVYFERSCAPHAALAMRRSVSGGSVRRNSRFGDSAYSRAAFTPESHALKAPRDVLASWTRLSRQTRRSAAELARVRDFYQKVGPASAFLARRRAVRKASNTMDHAARRRSVRFQSRQRTNAPDVACIRPRKRCRRPLTPRMGARARLARSPADHWLGSYSSTNHRTVSCRATKSEQWLQREHQLKWRAT